LQPELLAQDAASLLEDPEGVGLPAGGVESQNQQPAKPFSQRVFGDELFQLNDGALMATQLELDVEPLLDRGEAQLGQTGDRPRGEVLVGEVGERIAPPKRIGLGKDG